MNQIEITLVKNVNNNHDEMGNHIDNTNKNNELNENMRCSCLKNDKKHADYEYFESITTLEGWTKKPEAKEYDNINNNKHNYNQGNDNNNFDDDDNDLNDLFDITQYHDNNNKLCDDDNKYDHHFKNVLSNLSDNLTKPMQKISTNNFRKKASIDDNPLLHVNSHANQTHTCFHHSNSNKNSPTYSINRISSANYYSNNINTNTNNNNNTRLKYNPHDNMTITATNTPATLTINNNSTNNTTNNNNDSLIKHANTSYEMFILSSPQLTSSPNKKVNHKNHVNFTKQQQQQYYPKRHYQLPIRLHQNHINNNFNDDNDYYYTKNKDINSFKNQHAYSKYLYKSNIKNNNTHSHHNHHYRQFSDCSHDNNNNASQYLEINNSVNRDVGNINSTIDKNKILNTLVLPAHTFMDENLKSHEMYTKKKKSSNYTNTTRLQNTNNAIYNPYENPIIHNKAITKYQDSKLPLVIRKIKDIRLSKEDNKIIFLQQKNLNNSNNSIIIQSGEKPLKCLLKKKLDIYTRSHSIQEVQTTSNNQFDRRRALSIEDKEFNKQSQKEYNAFGDNSNLIKNFEASSDIFKFCENSLVNLANSNPNPLNDGPNTITSNKNAIINKNSRSPSLFLHTLSNPWSMPHSPEKMLEGNVTCMTPCTYGYLKNNRIFVQVEPNEERILLESSMDKIKQKQGNKKEIKRHLKFRDLNKLSMTNIDRESSFLNMDHLFDNQFKTKSRRMYSQNGLDDQKEDRRFINLTEMNYKRKSEDIRNDHKFKSIQKEIVYDGIVDRFYLKVKEPKKHKTNSDEYLYKEETNKDVIKSQNYSAYKNKIFSSTMRPQKISQITRKKPWNPNKTFMLKENLKMSTAYSGISFSEKKIENEAKLDSPKKS